ncbi:hypothethical protein (plasmid) [Ralstonia solanacearum CMR15]|nr:hypothethical protein [Ralstonia solanacearum CMR15]
MSAIVSDLAGIPDLAKRHFPFFPRGDTYATIHPIARAPAQIARDNEPQPPSTPEARTFTHPPSLSAMARPARPVASVSELPLRIAGRRCPATDL